MANNVYSGNFFKELAVNTATGFRRVFGSRLNLWVTLGLLAGAIITPIVFPISKVWLLIGLASTAAIAVGRSAYHWLVRPGGAAALDSPDTNDGESVTASVKKGNQTGKQQEQREMIANLAGMGEKTGDEMTDALVDRLRAMKINVSTNWDAAKVLIDTFPEKFASLKDNKDDIRGFVWEGRVFINPDKVTSEVVIHEYTHLWAEALRHQNPNEWKSIVEALKQETELWNEVKARYPHLETDNEIADEVLATYSGRSGYQKLQSYCVQDRDPETVFQKLFEALEAFWKAVGRIFNIKDGDWQSVDDIADLSLYSLLKGVNPLNNLDPNQLTLSDQVPLGIVDSKNSCKVVAIGDSGNKTMVAGSPEISPAASRNSRAAVVGLTPIAKIIADRLQDPSPHATFTTYQQDILLGAMGDTGTVSEKMKALKPYWLEAISGKAGTVPDEWKEDVVDEIYDLACGIRRQQTDGLKLN